MPLAETSFDVEALARKRQIEMMTETIRVCSPEDLVIYKMISTRPRDREDLSGVIRRQQDKLDDRYVIGWLRQFEQALDDSTLIDSYRRLRNIAD